MTTGMTAVEMTTTFGRISPSRQRRMTPSPVIQPITATMLWLLWLIRPKVTPIIDMMTTITTATDTTTMIVICISIISPRM